jgi:hypothetical protein
MNQFTESNSETRKIEAYEISHHARLGALPRHFGCYMMTFEGLVYDLMREFSPEYTGGNWRYMELSNGSFYMTPPQRTYRLTVRSNGYEGEMSADAAGITVCLFSYSLLSFKYPGTDVFTRHFHRLRDFAMGHAEAA